MTALFIGHCYTDITFLTNHIPTGNEKTLGQDFAFGVGGNAVVASFTAANLGVRTDLLTQVAHDRLGDVFLQRAAKMGIRIYPIPVKKSSASLILPNDDKRAIVMCRDTEYLGETPEVNLSGYSILHYDGHLENTPVELAKKASEQSILTSLDGGNVRENTEELLKYTQVAIVSEDFAADLNKTPGQTLEYLVKHGASLPGITLGDGGMLFMENGIEIMVPAINVPKEEIKDSTGAGDIFHGAYVASYLRGYGNNWKEHFEFATAASAISLKTIGGEASIPNKEDILKLLAEQ